MKVEITNTRKTKDKFPLGVKWTYGYIFTEGEMMFWKRNELVENFNDCAIETYRDCYPYAGAMNPRMYFRFNKEPIRMGVVGIDEKGIPFVFYTRYYKNSAVCDGMFEMDYDEVSDLKIT